MKFEVSPFFFLNCWREMKISNLAMIELLNDLIAAHDQISTVNMMLACWLSVRSEIWDRKVRQQATEEIESRMENGNFQVFFLFSIHSELVDDVRLCLCARWTSVSVRCDALERAYEEAQQHAKVSNSLHSIQKICTDFLLSFFISYVCNTLPGTSWFN